MASGETPPASGSWRGVVGGNGKCISRSRCFRVAVKTEGNRFEAHLRSPRAQSHRFFPCRMAIIMVLVSTMHVSNLVAPGPPTASQVATGVSFNLLDLLSCLYEAGLLCHIYLKEGADHFLRSWALEKHCFLLHRRFLFVAWHWLENPHCVPQSSAPPSTPRPNPAHSPPSSSSPAPSLCMKEKLR